MTAVNIQPDETSLVQLRLYLYVCRRDMRAGSAVGDIHNPWACGVDDYLSSSSTFSLAWEELKERYASLCKE